MLFSELWNHFTKMIGSCEQEEGLNHASGSFSSLRAFLWGPTRKWDTMIPRESQALERLCWFCLWSCKDHLAPSSLCVFSHMQVGNHAISDGHQYKKLLPFLPLEVGVGGCVWGEEDKWGLELKSHTSWLCHSTPLELFFYILI